MPLGLMYSWLAPSFFKDNESVHSVWHTLEWVSNSFVFLVAGMVIGYRSLSFFNGPDIANIVVIFLLIQIIRCVMVLFLYPCVNCLGKPCTVNEALFIAFSGLRGAICICLGLSFCLAAQAGETKVSAFEGQRMVFYIGAIAALTLIFNATFAEFVLQVLNLSENTFATPCIEVMRQYTKKRLIESSTPLWLEIPIIHRKIIVTKCQLLKEVDTACEKIGKISRNHSVNQDPTTSTTNMNTVRSRSSSQTIPPQRERKSLVLVPNVKSKLSGNNLTNPIQESEVFKMAKAQEITDLHENTLKLAQAVFVNRPFDCEPNSEMMENVRSAFLECVRSYYWTRVHKAIIERHSYVTRTLIASVDLGLETTNTPGLQVSSSQTLNINCYHNGY